MKQKIPLKTALAAAFGYPISLTNTNPMIELANALSSASYGAGQTINEKSILSISAAWACTKFISQTIATLPINLYERTDQGRRLASEHHLYRVLHTSPNAYSTPATFWGANLFSMLLRGNGWNRKIYNSLGQVIGLEFLHPDRSQAIRDQEGRLAGFRYRVSQYETIEIPIKEIFYIPNVSLDGRFGASTIAYGASVFGSALAANSAANETFKNGLMPTIAFKMDKVLKGEQREEFRTAFAELAGALNAGKPIVLEGGMSSDTVGIDPKDAQLLESRNYSGEEVCRWFGVDPSLVGFGGKDSNFGTGLEQKTLGTLIFTLSPIIKNIEQYINKELLSPADQMRFYAEFNIEALLRADSAARSAFYVSMVNNGLMTRNEVRRKENLPEMEGNADKLTVHSAMMPIDSLGETATIAQALMFGNSPVLNEKGAKDEK